MIKEVCNICGGSGQVCYFQGVSRFLFTWEECSACCGVGHKVPLKSDDKVDNIESYENNNCDNKTNEK